MGVKQPFDFDWSQVEFGVMKLTDMTPNPDNPRTITADQLSTLRKSLTDGPRNLLLNPIKIDSNNVILGGNQRHTGLLELGYIEAPFIKAGPKFTQDEIQQFIVMDNVSAGEFDWQDLALIFDQVQLEEWGLELPGFDVDSEDYGDQFSLPDGDKSPFQQQTYTLADDQAEQIKNAIADVKKTEEYKYVETFGNENSNGNALYLIVMQWAEQKT